jgi:acyl-ACP thioesterase
MSAAGGTSGAVPEPSPEFAPLVPRPDDVRAFSHERRAGVAEVAPTGRLRLDSIARWAQDVAWADVVDAGLRDLTIWLVRRTRIRVRSFPRLDESYRLTTYVTGLGRMWAERRTDIVPSGVCGASGPSGPSGPSGVSGASGPSGASGASGSSGEEDESIVQVSCLWVHIDPERLMPSPIQQVEIDTWTGASTRPVKARLHHPAPAADAAARDWTFRASELDVAEHVNNAAYFTPLDDELLSISSAPGAGDVETVDLEIEYRGPSHAGPHNVLAAGPMRWIANGAGEVTASAMLADWPA